MTAMEKRVEAEIEGTSPEEVIRLDLDACKSKKIAGLTEKFAKLERLSIMHNELKSLDGLPKLPSLLRLDLSENPITEGLETLVENCPNLETLAICGNENLKDVSFLEPLKKLEKLRALDIVCTPLANDVKDYSEQVFKLLPQVKFVDGLDADGQEAPDSDEDDDDEIVDDEDEDEDEEDEDGAEDEEEAPGLKTLYDGELGDDTEEFEVIEGEEEDEEDSDIDDEEEGDEETKDDEEGEEDTKRGKKRKLEDEEDADKA